MLSQFSSSSLLLCFHGMRHNLGTFLTSTNDDTNMILTGSQDQEAFSTNLEKSEWKHSYLGLKIIITFFCRNMPSRSENRIFFDDLQSPQ